MSLSQYPPFLWRWTKHAARGALSLKSFWCFVAGLVLVWGASRISSGDPAGRATAAGYWMQLLGVSSVAWGLRRHRKIFNLDSQRDQFLKWFKRGPKLEPQHLILKGGGHLPDLQSSGSGHFWFGHDPNAPAEQRLSSLESNVDTLKRLVGDLQRALRKETDARYSADKEEKAERTTGQADLSDKLESFAIGGIKLETVGLAWLIQGILLSGFPHWFAPLFFFA